MAFCRCAALPRNSARATATRNDVAISPVFTPWSYDVTALITLKSVETLCEDHDDCAVMAPSVRSVGEPSVPTRDELKSGVSGASVLKGSFESPFKRSARKMLDDALTEASMTTERDDGAFGSSKCKNAR